MQAAGSHVESARVLRSTGPPPSEAVSHVGVERLMIVTSPRLCGGAKVSLCSGSGEMCCVKPWCKGGWPQRAAQLRVRSRCYTMSRLQGRLLFIICPERPRPGSCWMDGTPPGVESGERCSQLRWQQHVWGCSLSGCVRAIWQSRAGGPLREIEGNGVNIEAAYRHPAVRQDGGASQPS
jgi:hypothetical protein